MRAHAILLLGDEDADEGRGTRVPVEIWSRVLTCGLADPAARVRETAALVSNELQVSKAARAKLPPPRWGQDKKKVSAWPLVWISGFWHPAEPPKVLPPWVLEEIVRRLRQPYHRHAAAGVHFLRSIDKSLPSVVVEALFERARRARPSPGAIQLLVQVMGLTDETRPLLDAGLHAEDLYQRRDVVGALLSAASAEERLAFIAEHANDLAIRSEIVQHLMRRVDAASWEACRPLLEALAVHPDPKIAGAARESISSTQKYSR